MTTAARPHRTRRTRRIAATLALTAAALVQTAQPAGAHDDHGRSVLMACAGTVAASYAPGLTYVPRDTSINSRAVVGCPVSSDPSVSSATFGGESSGTLSCLLGPASGTLTLHWGGHAKKTSTAHISSVAAVRPNGNIVTVSTGSITDGAFKGATVITEVTLLASRQTACLTPQGLTAASGPTTVTVARL
ncbi:hypothetical protein [Streptomyces luteireticuli]|uniref:Ig-like domain-containing protein n=1 Tax=Streptomyces luteireticuli TaxID=173858 RepID=A0ABP3IH88_9ACTN